MPLLKKILRRFVVSLLRIAAGVPIISLLAGGLLFLLFGATTTGRSVALSATILAVVLYLSVGYWRRGWFRRIRNRLYAIAVPISLLLYLVPMMLAPTGGDADGRVRNCLLHGAGRFSRFSPWNVVPEADQIHVGMCLLPLGDPYTTFAKAARMRSLILPLYDEMDRDADFHPLGSAMAMAYRDLFHMEFRSGHYFVCASGDGPRQAVSLPHLSARFRGQPQGLSVGPLKAA